MNYLEESLLFYHIIIETLNDKEIVFNLSQVKELEESIEKIKGQQLDFHVVIKDDNNNIITYL